MTGDIRAMIHGALEEVGGQSYLVTQAKDNPQAFMTLLGKVLPKELTGADGKDLFPFDKIVTELVRPK